MTIRLKKLKDKLFAGAKHLQIHDPILGTIIAKHGTCTITPHTDYYRQLVSSIIGQQLSVKSASAIKKRFVAYFGDKFPTPLEISSTDSELFRPLGLSRPKITYIKDLATHIIDRRLKIKDLPKLSNEEIVTELTAVKGIGVWTAHMFLIFSLGRLDVLAHGDLGVRSAIKRLYKLQTLPTPTEVIELSEINNWHPYESLVCWYLWRSLDNE